MMNALTRAAHARRFDVTATSTRTLLVLSALVSAALWALIYAALSI